MANSTINRPFSSSQTVNVYQGRVSLKNHRVPWSIGLHPCYLKIDPIIAHVCSLFANLGVFIWVCCWMSHFSCNQPPKIGCVWKLGKNPLDVCFNRENECNPVDLGTLFSDKPILYIYIHTKCTNEQSTWTCSQINLHRDKICFIFGLQMLTSASSWSQPSQAFVFPFHA